MNRESIDAKTLREWLESGEKVTVVDVRHAEEHADVWLGFRRDLVKGFFEDAGLSGFGCESLGMQ